MLRLCICISYRFVYNVLGKFIRYFVGSFVCLIFVVCLDIYVGFCCNGSNEKMGGKLWEMLVKELLFELLGMKDSGFVSDVKNFILYFLVFVYVDGRLERVD